MAGSFIMNVQLCNYLETNKDAIESFLLFPGSRQLQGWAPLREKNLQHLF
jgi:hypothetical protein